MARALREQSLPGTIRQLRASDRSEFGDHLLRLDAAGRRDRFNGGLSDGFVAAYAGRCFVDGTIVIGYVEGGKVHGAAELHDCPDIDEPTGEIAFSVEPAFQGRGIGTELFERLLAHARATGYTRLRVTTHPENARMRRLAAKFKARLNFQAGETVGIIELDPLPARRSAWSSLAASAQAWFMPWWTPRSSGRPIGR